MALSGCKLCFDISISLIALNLRLKNNIESPESDVRRYRLVGQTSKSAWNPQLSDKFGGYFTVRPPRFSSLQQDVLSASNQCQLARFLLDEAF